MTMTTMKKTMTTKITPPANRIEPPLSHHRVSRILPFLFFPFLLLPPSPPPRVSSPPAATAAVVFGLRCAGGSFLATPAAPSSSIGFEPRPRTRVPGYRPPPRRTHRCIRPILHPPLPPCRRRRRILTLSLSHQHRRPEPWPTGTNENKPPSQQSG